MVFFQGSKRTEKTHGRHRPESKKEPLTDDTLVQHADCHGCLVGGALVGGRARALTALPSVAVRCEHHGFDCYHHIAPLAEPDSAPCSLHVGLALGWGG